jgi:hypothetical protein
VTLATSAGRGAPAERPPGSLRVGIFNDEELAVAVDEEDRDERQQRADEDGSHGVEPPSVLMPPERRCREDQADECGRVLGEQPRSSGRTWP